VTEITLHGARPAGAPHPRLGYAMVTAASTLFAVNASVSKIGLTDGGISNLRLTELRATGAFLGLAAFVLATAPGRLRVATVSMIEVLLAALVAWVWLDEALSAWQLLGGAVVLVGVVLAQTSR
jgi:drug/metabolite transporter (DMT)-like permease